MTEKSLRMQVDFGIGDVMVLGPRMIEYPVLVSAKPFTVFVPVCLLSNR